MSLLQEHNMKIFSTVLLLALQLTSSAKTNARPVYEVINEQSRADDSKLIKTSAVASLPYGNPLAGNSQQNAKLHAHNQQAMFNAEKIRQHKAQLQRWMKTPTIDSYMRAYHESQENHQLALEQQQANHDDNKPMQVQSAKELKGTAKAQNDATKMSKSVVMKPERKRNHRSYGSVEYQTVYLPSTVTYDQGLVKPNVINNMVQPEITKLYSDASPSSEFIYSKYYPAQDYQSVQDIVTLNSLLNKNPGEQLTQFNALINSAKGNENHDKELETPIDLYFYLKDPSKRTLPEHYGQAEYTQILNTQETSQDYKPVMEVDDAEKSKGSHSFNVQSISEQPNTWDVTASKNIQYINSELTNQILSTGYNPLYQEEYHELEEKPTYQALQHGNQLSSLYSEDEDRSEDLSKRYIHHNTHKGVHHLTQDGLGVSAYDDENLQYAASYEFGYRVRDLHTGNDFGHQEAKNGKETNGHYHVLLPDGRMQNVRYSAGPEGFHADISYDHQK